MKPLKILGISLLTLTFIFTFVACTSTGSPSASAMISGRWNVSTDDTDDDNYSMQFQFYGDKLFQWYRDIDDPTNYLEGTYSLSSGRKAIQKIQGSSDLLTNLSTDAKVGATVVTMNAIGIHRDGEVISVAKDNLNGSMEFVLVIDSDGKTATMENLENGSRFRLTKIED